MTSRHARITTGLNNAQSVFVATFYTKKFMVKTTVEYPLSSKPVIHDSRLRVPKNYNKQFSKCNQ